VEITMSRSLMKLMKSSKKSRQPNPHASAYDETIGSIL